MAAQIEESVVVDGENVLIIRSAKRTRTVSADLRGGQLRLRVPMRLSNKEVTTHARAFRKRLDQRSGSGPASDEQLLRRALELSKRYVDSSPSPTSVSWSTRQLQRWGSTTSTTGAIRLSARLQTMPDWVVDSVLVHELAHLIESGHGPRFKNLISRYPRTAEADAFLAGVSWAEQNLRTAENARGE